MKAALTFLPILLVAACGSPQAAQAAQDETLISLSTPGAPSAWAHCFDLPKVDDEADATADGPPASEVTLKVHAPADSAETAAVIECLSAAGVDSGSIETRSVSDPTSSP